VLFEKIIHAGHSLRCLKEEIQNLRSGPLIKRNRYHRVMVPRIDETSISLK
jgi:hypothetical protein